MLIDTEIMAENWNWRWRPSAILDFGKPDFWPMGRLGLLTFHLFIGPHQHVKFYANPMHSFEVMAIWFFLQIWLEPLNVIGHHRDPQKAHPWPKPHLHANYGTDRSTGATCAWAEEIKKIRKRQGKKLRPIVANWVFSQTTHVDAAICGLACRVVFGR